VVFSILNWNHIKVIKNHFGKLFLNSSFLNALFVWWRDGILSPHFKLGSYKLWCKKKQERNINHLNITEWSLVLSDIIHPVSSIFCRWIIFRQWVMIGQWVMITTLVEQFSKISKVIIGYPETSPNASRVKDGHQDEA